MTQSTQRFRLYGIEKGRGLIEIDVPPSEGVIAWMLSDHLRLDVTIAPATAHRTAQKRGHWRRTAD